MYDSLVEVVTTAQYGLRELPTEQRGYERGGFYANNAAQGWQTGFAPTGLGVQGIPGGVTTNLPNISPNTLDAAYNNVAGTVTLNVVPDCFTPPPNMKAWWTTDNTTRDIAGGNDGSGATYAAGKVNQAFSLNGTGSRVLVGDPVPAPLRIQNEITLDAWIYLTEYPLELGLIVGSQYDPNRAGATIFIDGRTNPDGQSETWPHLCGQTRWPVLSAVSLTGTSNARHPSGKRRAQR